MQEGTHALLLFGQGLAAESHAEGVLRVETCRFACGSGQARRALWTEPGDTALQGTTICTKGFAESAWMLTYVD